MALVNHHNCKAKKANVSAVRRSTRQIANVYSGAAWTQVSANRTICLSEYYIMAFRFRNVMFQFGTCFGEKENIENNKVLVETGTLICA